MKTLIILFYVFTFVKISFSNQDPVTIPKFLTGNEIFPDRENVDPPVSFSAVNIPKVQTSLGWVTYHLTNVFTTYDVQSNGVPKQLWQDPLIPLNLHAAVMNSSSATLSPKYCTYLFSQDNGNTWFNLGYVPYDSNSAFPTISGLQTGSAVIANHNNTNSTPVRTKIYVDLGAGIGAFTEYDPGNFSSGESLFPAVLGIGHTKILFAGQEFINSVQLPSGYYSGFQNYQGGTPNGYWLARSNDGKIGHTYIGTGFDIHDVFYRYSTDDGITWSTPSKIWDWNIWSDSIGVLRGISMVYLNQNPYIAFETMPLTDTEFFPGRPSQIRLWSPAVNSGVPIVIADSSQVPFYPNTGIVGDGFTPICRPAIGKSDTYNALIVVFNSTTEFFSPVDSSRFYSCWMTYGFDSGNFWSTPERITPYDPSNRDWRYISITDHAGSFSSINMMVQVDSVAGSYIHGAQPSHAQFVGMNLYTNSIINISNEIPSNFLLYQNYPNPFNPTTNIKFDLPENTNLSLIVFDITGREVKRLIDNKSYSAGKYLAEFNAQDLSSGIYFYSLRTDKFYQTKKLVVVK